MREAMARLCGSAFAPVAVAVAALVAALARWQLQGSRNVYTALHKRFYVADPDLGWRVSSQHPIWLGLEICAIVAGAAIALAIAGWIVRRREAKRGRRAPIVRAAGWLVAVATLVVPIAAFVSGPGPADARDTLPTTAATSLDAGIAGALAAPAGRYEVVTHAGTSITARLSAGGETFDARFDGDIAGWWQGDPHDLGTPSRGEVSVAAASVDTGIGERSQHARDGYLHADRFPRIAVALDRVLAAKQQGPAAVAFRAHGSVALIGKTHAVEIVGTLREPDAAALGRLGLTGHVLLVDADFSIAIKDTAFAADAGDFDGDRIPIHVSLVLRAAGG